LLDSVASKTIALGNEPCFANIRTWQSSFAADESRWTRYPSSVSPSTRNSVQNKLC